MPFIDTHCHLDAPAYADLATVCRQSEQAGVAAIVAVGTGLASNRRILALQRRQPAHVWAALGLHPERPDASWDEVEAVLDQLRAHRDRVVALGEVGLPHYALLDGSMMAEQARRHEGFLHALVKGVVALGLPVVLHAPHAAADKALAILRRYEPSGVVFHWHKGSPETTAAICEAGYFVSVTPEACYRERDRELGASDAASQPAAGNRRPLAVRRRVCRPAHDARSGGTPGRRGGAPQRRVAGRGAGGGVAKRPAPLCPRRTGF